MLSYPQYLQRQLSTVNEKLARFACPLSKRELEVLELVALGYGNKEIAHHLAISCQTIKNHMSAILQKTGAESRLDAALMGLAYGWVPIDTICVVTTRMELNRERDCDW